MIRQGVIIALLGLTYGLWGCVEQRTTYRYDAEQGLLVEQRFSKWFDPNQPVVPSQVNWEKVSPDQRIRFAGYGAVNPNQSLSKAQRTILAQRAAKLDAYRALAERVYGLKVDAETQVRDVATQDDRVRVMVDAYLRGAKVITTTRMDDGSYEIIMELVLSPDFSQCARGADQCPLPQLSLGKPVGQVQCVEGDCQPQRPDFYLQEH